MKSGASCHPAKTANLTLVYLWHPLFSEELGFWPKLMLQMLGQFTFVTLTVALCISVLRRLNPPEPR